MIKQISETIAEHNGIRFYKNKIGYYRSKKLNKSLHRYIYECEKGKIPEGYIVHHIDHDKRNNDISNLKILTILEHERLHFNELTPEQYKTRMANYKKKSEAAALWHKTEKGKESLRKATKIRLEKAKNNVGIDICIVCGKEIKHLGFSKAKYCSDKCMRKAKYKNDLSKSKIRETTCLYCGKPFKYKSTKIRKLCSPHCVGMYLNSKKAVKNNKKK